MQNALHDQMRENGPILKQRQKAMGKNMTKRTTQELYVMDEVKTMHQGKGQKNIQKMSQNVEHARGQHRNREQTIKIEKKEMRIFQSIKNHWYSDLRNPVNIKGNVTSQSRHNIQMVLERVGDTTTLQRTESTMRCHHAEEATMDQGFPSPAVNDFGFKWEVMLRTCLNIQKFMDGTSCGPARKVFASRKQQKQKADGECKQKSHEVQETTDPNQED